VIRKLKKILCWAVASLTGLGTPGSGGEEVVDLEPFAVRAWSFEGLDLNFPGDVTVSDRGTIAQSFATSLPELLAQESNLRFESITGNRSQGQVSLRGFGENSGLRVLVVVDGQRVNRPDLGGTEWRLVPVEDSESVEVIRGGQNVLYGNYALAGVIQVTTRRGGPSRSHLEGRAGSDGLRRVAIDHAGGTEGWYWDFNAEFFEEAGYRDNAAQRNQGISGTIGLKTGNPKYPGTLSFSGTWMEGKTQFPGPLLFEDYRTRPRQSRSLRSSPR